MNDCVILYRVVDERVCRIVFEDNLMEVHVFPNMDTAIAFCDDSGWIRAKGLTYQIVELDELMTTTTPTPPAAPPEHPTPAMIEAGER